MTQKQLGQLHYIHREIERDQERLCELVSIAEGCTGNISGMPRGIRISDKVGNLATSIAQLRQDIAQNLERCMNELACINRFIQQQEDSYIRQILSLRYVNGLGWNQVAASIGGGNTADSVRMAHNRFFKSLGDH